MLPMADVIPKLKPTQQMNRVTSIQGLAVCIAYALLPQF